MKRQNHKVIVWLRVCVLAMFCPAFLWRCATVMNLEGGPIDTLPPVIVSMLPDNFTTNFTASKIYVTFDEFVQLKDQQKEFFTSPQMKKKPQLSIRGRGILIQIKDTLKENTTYALNFGSAVRDNNEGNPLYSMRYVFSTGPEVDSMVVSGYTADSYTADSVAKSFIYFFPADSVEDIPEYDSTMFKYQPAVIARAETNGIFIAQNLKPIPYRVYAFEDKNNNQIYEPSVDQVGFLTGTYNPAELPDFGIWYDSIRRYVTADPQLYFRMFTDEAFGRQYLRESERPVQHKALLYFNAGHPRIDSIVFDSIPADRVIIEPQSRNRDTIALWFDVPSASLPDTIRGEITYMKHDSLDRLLPSTEKLKLAWRYIESKVGQRARAARKGEREDTGCRRRVGRTGEAEYVYLQVFHDRFRYPRNQAVRRIRLPAGPVRLGCRRADRTDGEGGTASDPDPMAAGYGQHAALVAGCSLAIEKQLCPDHPQRSVGRCGGAAKRFDRSQLHGCRSREIRYVHRQCGR